MPLTGVPEAQAYVLLAIVTAIGGVVAANLTTLVPDGEAMDPPRTRDATKRRRGLIWFCVLAFLLVWAYFPIVIAYNELDWPVIASVTWADVSPRMLYWLLAGPDLRHYWHVVALVLIAVAFMRVFRLLYESERSELGQGPASDCD